MTRLLFRISMLTFALNLFGSWAFSAPEIHLEKTEALVGEPVGLQLRGLKPNSEILLRAKMLYYGSIYHSHAAFRVGATGIVNVATQAPFRGTYTAADIWGPYWSMTFDHPAISGELSEGIAAFDIEQDNQTVATAELKRTMSAPGVTSADLRENGLYGTFSVPKSDKKLPALIILGGSEGGLATAGPLAPYFASRGYAALGLAYFGVEGSVLPAKLERVPLEYFEKALAWLKSRPEVDATRIGVIGFSRGAELALTLGSKFPDFKSVVAIGPSGLNWGNFVQPEHSSWKYHQADLPFVPFTLAADTFEKTNLGIVAHFRSSYLLSLQSLKDSSATELATIPVENTKGSILLISGEDDHVWPACVFANLVIKRLTSSGHSGQDESFCYTGAGHVPPIPGSPTTTTVIPFNKERTYWLDLGGQPQQTAEAGVKAWRKINQFLRKNLYGALNDN